jgi:hypothetical protein
MHALDEELQVVVTQLDVDVHRHGWILERAAECGSLPSGFHRVNRACRR